jgi:hypothetical protein
MKHITFLQSCTGLGLDLLLIWKFSCDETVLSHLVKSFSLAKLIYGQEARPSFAILMNTSGTVLVKKKSFLLFCQVCQLTFK